MFVMLSIYKKFSFYNEKSKILNVFTIVIYE